MFAVSRSDQRSRSRASHGGSRGHSDAYKRRSPLLRGPRPAARWRPCPPWRPFSPRGAVSESLPPPPLELSVGALSRGRAMSLQHDDVDDLPLPPPPDELSTATPPFGEGGVPRGRIAASSSEHRGRTMATNEVRELWIEII